MSEKKEGVWEKKTMLLSWDEFSDEPKNGEDFHERFNIQDVPEIKENDDNIIGVLLAIHNKLIDDTGKSSSWCVLQELMKHPQAGSILMAFISEQINAELQRASSREKFGKLFEGFCHGEF
jgi:hypothetical protein